MSTYIELYQIMQNAFWNMCSWKPCKFMYYIYVRYFVNTECSCRRVAVWLMVCIALHPTLNTFLVTYLPDPGCTKRHSSIITQLLDLYCAIFHNCAHGAVLLYGCLSEVNICTSGYWICLPQMWTHETTIKSHPLGWTNLWSLKCSATPSSIADCKEPTIQLFIF